MPRSSALGSLFDEMKRHGDDAPGGSADFGYVFLSPRGKRWHERNFARAFDRLRTRAAKENVRPLHFHCTRHSFASWAIEGGRSIKWVQKQLGHASAELTLRTYAHLLPDEPGDLDFLLRPPTGPKTSQTKKRRRRKCQAAQCKVLERETGFERRLRLLH